MWVRLSLLLVIGVPTGLPGQAAPNQPPTPDDSLYGLAVDRADYPGQDYVLLLDDGLVVIESDGRSSYTMRQVAQVLTSDGAAMLGEFGFVYTPGRQNLRINWMRVIADGTLRQDGPEHQTESDAGVQPGVPVYSERKIVQATLAGVAPGVLIDYSVTLETTRPRLAGDLLYEWAINTFVPVVRSRFVVDAPAGLPLRISERNVGVSSDSATAAGRVVRTWQLENLPAVEFERFAGFPNDVQMSIRVAGGISWDEIGAWYAELMRDRFELADGLADAFTQVAEDSRTLEDSLKAAYRWVTQDFRYVALLLGDGGYQPRPPLEVYRTRFGDCKDKTTLFIALTRAMGLAAHPVLVSSGGVVDSLLPSIKQYDHMIAAVEQEGRVEYLDLTAELTPYRELSPKLQGAVALVLHDDGTARIVVLPESDPETNRLETELVGTVRRDGTFVGSITVSATGTEQYDLRASFVDFGDLGESDRQDVLQSWGGTWNTATIDSSRVFDGRDLDGEARMTLWITAPRVVHSAGGQYMMSLPIASFGNNALVASLESAGKRRFPIDIAAVNSPSVHRHVLDLALPEGWTARVPKNVRVEGPFGYYRGEYQQVGTRFLASREMGGLRGLLPPDSMGALIAWLRDVSKDATEHVIIDRTTGPALATVPEGADNAGEIARLLPGTEDLGAGAVVAEEGPAGGEGFSAISGARMISSWTREFAAEQMIFTVGNSRLMNIAVTVAEFGSGAEAVKGQAFFDLLDVPVAFRLFFEEQGLDQASIGEVQAMDLATLGESARGWRMEIVTPVATFDIAIMMLARGRVSVTLMAMGLRGMKTEDLERVARIVDERILQNESYLADLDPEPVAVGHGAEAEGPGVADRADGVALDELLPGAGDFPGSMLASEELARVDGVPVYTRELDGRGFTFSVGGSDVISMMLDVELHPTEAQAMGDILRWERQSPLDQLAEAMESDLGQAFFQKVETSSRRFDVPAVGSRATGVLWEVRGAMRLDVVGITFASGRLVASVSLTARAGGLAPTVLNPIAEDIHRRMLRVAPGIATGSPAEDVTKAVERMIASELEVDSLVDARMFEAAFAAIARADLAGAPVSFAPDTWNNVCWYASLHGFAEQAMPACEAAVSPDTTRVDRRDSRGLARALVGDMQGAIEDFRFVVEHSTAGEFLEMRSDWLDALLAGGNPFTDEVLLKLRGS